MNKVWTEYEKEFIRVNADTMKDEELAERLQKISRRRITLNSVRKVRQLMGIKKKPGRGLCILDNHPNNGEMKWER